MPTPIGTLRLPKTSSELFRRLIDRRSLLPPRQQVRGTVPSLARAGVCRDVDEARIEQVGGRLVEGLSDDHVDPVPAPDEDRLLTLEVIGRHGCDHKHPARLAELDDQVGIGGGPYAAVGVVASVISWSTTPGTSCAVRDSSLLVKGGTLAITVG
jgi:hypothetical protein